ncbi:MAG: cobalamin-dependent protein [Candidatus Latescibacteria bacterium]|nr:cobalamin-dependent protein [Candidatus Latescibacterota bacterium]
MKILLINPNRYRNPPVPPLALEYLAGALEDTHHECRILDLCFAENPTVEIDAAVQAFGPDIAGFTIRNIDTVIYNNNIFFLDEIKSFVEHIKSYGIPVVAGGVGFSFIPGGILDYLGADWGVCGPGERALLHILDLLDQKSQPEGRVLNGWEIGIDSSKKAIRNMSLDYDRYIQNRGLIGFETQKGCYEVCSYCSEGNRHVIFKNPADIADEIELFTYKGINMFHLCDTEFNQDLSHCKAFLNELINRQLDISWSVYMKTSPYDEELFSLLKASGVHIITLSIPTGYNSLDLAKDIGKLTKKYEIKLAVDFLCGFPGDTVKSIKTSIDTLREIKPDTVGINSYFRLYPKLTVTKQILSTPEYINFVFGELQDNSDLIKPVFYNHIGVDSLRDIIGDDPLFTIEGFERTSNYERIK